MNLIGQKLDHLIVFSAADQAGPWTPVPITEVPDWVKDPDVMGYLVAGETVTDPAIGPLWFRAEKVKRVVVH